MARHRTPCLMTLAKRVFTVAAIYGVISVLPLYFLEDVNARLDPPAINHPEYYYGFLGVVLVWQAAYFLCGRDPIRFRPFMLLCASAKGVWALTALVLLLLHRCAPTILAAT